MPVVFMRGDIFNSNAQTLVCPVNTVGKMGKGLAEAMAKRFRGLYPQYVTAVIGGAMTPHSLTLFRVGHNKQILCFPTKEHWRNDSNLTLVEEGLIRLTASYQGFNIQSLAVPALGCGEGKLSWNDVHPLITKYLNPLPIMVEVYEPTYGV